MRKLLAALGIGVLCVALAGCTPREGGRCTTVGEIVTTKDGVQLQCRTDTDKGQRTPRWNVV